MKKNTYVKLNILRILSCIIVLLYHLGLCKGGFLAVFIFFTLTGYLSFITCYKKDNFSIKEYYKKRFIKLYLPVLFLVLITLAIISFFPNMIGLNLKREVTSILLGYNNYWQLNANLDYFVRHINSPFIHLWYIAILLQLEILFPWIFQGIKKLKEKNKIYPIIILSILSITSILVFLYFITNNKIMNAYYDTFSRSFSWLLGILLGYVHIEGKKLVNKSLQNIIYCLYIFIIILLSFTIDIKSNYLILSILTITIISLRIIDYSTLEEQKNNELINYISNITYEIYLVQYPIIYLFQSSNINNYIKIPIIISLTILLSILLNKALKQKKFTNILFLVLSILSVIGLGKYILLEDHTKEMNQLKEDLNENKEIMLEKQKQFREQAKQEKEEWNKLLNELNNEEELKEKVRNLPIVGIGDSIMELALKDLYKEFPNGYFDAVENRRPSQVNSILEDLKNQGILGDIVVFCIGTNGEFYDKYTIPIMETLENRKVFWLNATNADYDTFNGELYDLASRYSNIHIIDWVSVANEHPEYLISDKVHPTIHGCEVYAETIYNAIYDQIKEEQQKVIEEHEQKEKEKITFIGNDLLLGLYDDLENKYPNAEYIINEGKDSKSIIKEIEKNEINYKVVLLFDDNSSLTKKDYEDIEKVLKNHEIYSINTNIKNINNIEFERKKDDLKSDGIHLTDKGNEKLLKKIIEKLE